jgi:hypothetical protein
MDSLHPKRIYMLFSNILNADQKAAFWMCASYNQQSSQSRYCNANNNNNNRLIPPTIYCWWCVHAIFVKVNWNWPADSYTRLYFCHQIHPGKANWQRGADKHCSGINIDLWNLHYKMERHRFASGLCFFGPRSVLATQNGCAICAVAVLCQCDSIFQPTVFLSVTHRI